jgi:hypothetical protein
MGGPHERDGGAAMTGGAGSNDDSNGMHRGRDGMPVWTTTFFEWPQSVSEDGTLYLCSSDYADSGSHASGAVVIGPDSTDYELFLWAALQPRAPDGLLSNHLIDDLRPAFNEARSHARSPEEFRADLLSQFPVTPGMTPDESRRWKIRRAREQRLLRITEVVFTVVMSPVYAYFWMLERLRSVRKRPRNHF